MTSRDIHLFISSYSPYYRSTPAASLKFQYRKMAKLSDMADSTAGTEFLSLVEEVVEASEIPTKRRSTSIKSTVDRLSSTAYDRGILPDDLSRLIELITTPSHLDQASIASFIRNLYPVRNVPAENILQVVGSLGHGELKPSLAIQSQLLRWLIMVYHILESPGTLSQAYAVLFNLLDTAAIRSGWTFPTV